MIPKFRAWDKVAKVMIYHIEQTYDGLGYFKENENIEDYVSNISFECFSDWLENEQFVIMQSTGLFDKNGVEVFEGDVVRADDYKNIVVEFGKIEHEEDFGGFAIYQGFSLNLAGGYPEAVMNELEVIGNIYELESVEE